MYKYKLEYKIPGDYETIIYGTSNTQKDLLELIEKALEDGINEFTIKCTDKNKIKY